MSNEGKKVKAHYRGTLDDGSQFDSSSDRGEPIEFICCAGQMIPGFDAAVKDMALGEKKTVKIPCAEAYGEYNPAAVQHFKTADVPNADQLPVGEMIYLRGPGGQPMPAKVVSVDENEVVIDLNHALAGKDLTFEIELVEVAE